MDASCTRELVCTVVPETHRDLIGRPLSDVPTPALLVDAVLLERNLAAMAAHFADSRVVYRPHTKSHKSPLIAKMQLAHGARGVCCSKLGEAEVLVSGGVDDIHITTPVVGIDKLRRLAALAARARLSVVLDNAENVAELSNAASAAWSLFAVPCKARSSQPKRRRQPTYSDQPTRGAGDNEKPLDASPPE